ncbi:hypothetical protein NQH48_13470 [Pantoea sp. MMK3]|uniref:Uncharacterized protein n=1 Tax=Pantoea trifolii TaxID=2968030 RepID=A0ABT1VRC2_9GAMM|nr:hypothetical protein [Pantoea sp. MMK2]MCQ8237288.1 hypothetical protein [Pantoea sp. MMK3]
MNLHDPKRIVKLSACHIWRAFAYVMQVHENRHVKRVGVAGIALRAFCLNTLALKKWPRFPPSN